MSNQPQEHQSNVFDAVFRELYPGEQLPRAELINPDQIQGDPEDVVILDNYSYRDEPESGVGDYSSPPSPQPTLVPQPSLTLTEQALSNLSFSRPRRQGFWQRLFQGDDEVEQ